MPDTPTYVLVTELAARQAHRAPEEAGEMFRMAQQRSFDPVLFALWLQLEGFDRDERWWRLLEAATADARRDGALVAIRVADSLN